MSGFQDLRVGDELIRHYGIAGRYKSLVKITRITPTMLVCGDLRYYRKNGTRVGGSGFYSDHVFAVTTEQKAELRHSERVTALENHKWRNEKPELIATIYALLVGASTAAEREKEG